jgi:hypothetical protein
MNQRIVIGLTINFIFENKSGERPPLQKPAGTLWHFGKINVDTIEITGTHHNPKYVLRPLKRKE